MRSTRPIDDGLFSWPGEARLLAGSCAACGTTTFPQQASCPRCTGLLEDRRGAPAALHPLCAGRVHRCAHGDGAGPASPSWPTAAFAS